MKIVKARNYAEMSCRAAELLAAQILYKPHCVLGLATGSTPIGAYDCLVKRFESGELDFSTVTSVNLDEYVGLDGNNDQSYRYFMNTHLFDRVNIRQDHTFVPDGMAADPAVECAAYDDRIAALGGVDMQVLGIGNNGHIGFNEPDSCFTAGTHLVSLKESTILANARFFASEAEVPTRAITMGMKSIMQARKILLVAGKEKLNIVERAMYGDITPEVPASLLQLHRDLTVIVAEN